ncbi:ribokinase [Sarracenia purpurea var. burkii]
MAALSPSKPWYPNPKTQPNRNLKATQIQLINHPSTRRVNPLPSFAIHNNPNIPPLVVVGSANADIYVEIDRLPKEAETISAKSGQTLAGGKGANQAVCGGKLLYPTYFLGQVGEDAHGKLITEALEGGGVLLDHMNTVSAAPTGHAVVMLQSDGQNYIIIVGGANMSCWPDALSEDDLEVLRNAGIVLLQREIPDSVNIEVAKVRLLIVSP